MKIINGRLMSDIRKNYLISMAGIQEKIQTDTNGR